MSFFTPELLNYSLEILIFFWFQNYTRSSSDIKHFLFSAQSWYFICYMIRYFRFIKIPFKAHFSLNVNNVIVFPFFFLHCIHPACFWRLSLSSSYSMNYLPARTCPYHWHRKGIKGRRQGRMWQRSRINVFCVYNS